MPPLRACLAAAFLAFAPTVTTAAPGPDDPLSPWRWKARVLVLFAPDARAPGLARQRAMLDAESAGLAERDLVRIEVIGDAASDPRLSGVTLRRRLGAPADRFAIILVGKDGGVKLRRAEPVAGPTLFATIDAMPMRREEARGEQ